MAMAIDIIYYIHQLYLTARGLADLWRSADSTSLESPEAERTLREQKIIIPIKAKSKRSRSREAVVFSVFSRELFSCRVFWGRRWSFYL